MLPLRFPETIRETLTHWQGCRLWQSSSCQLDIKMVEGEAGLAAGKSSGAGRWRTDPEEPNRGTGLAWRVERRTSGMYAFLGRMYGVSIPVRPIGVHDVRTFQDVR